MRNPSDRRGSSSPNESLRLAIEAHTPSASGLIAKQALEQPVDDPRGESEATDPEDAVLLLREVFKSHVHAHRVRSAHAIARKMIRVGALSELAHADFARACVGLGFWMSAAQSFRLAARFAPARRRAMHWAACSSALVEEGRHDEALAALERAVRWSTTTRPLHRAQIALVQLEQGQAVPDLDALMAELSAARCGEGYGRYVLGRLMLLRGERAQGAKFLREFIQRNAHDPMRAVTLRGELARARHALRGLRAGRDATARGTNTTPSSTGEG